MIGRSLVTLALVWVLIGSGYRASLAAESKPGQAAKAKPAAAKPARPKITVSRETTFLTGPLRPDGHVDYLAATNAYCSKGVTPENNAVVLLVQAFGDRVALHVARQSFLRMG